MADSKTPEVPRGGGPLIAMSANDSWAILNYRRGLIAALQADGYRIAVLAPDGPLTPAIRALGADFRAVPMAARGTSPIGDLMTLIGYRRALRALRPAAYLGFTIKPNIYGSMAARSLSIPVINNITGLGVAFDRQGLLNRLVRRLYQVALGGSATVFFQNRDDRDLFVGQGLVRPGQAKLLPGSGVDTDHFAPRTRAGGPLTFLFAARLLWTKGVREFVEAARLLKGRGENLRFRILGPVEPPGGNAVAREDLEGWQAEGLVEYRGARDDVRPEIAEADCVVLPSYYREGVPRILLEAAAMGVPVIAADSIGCREAVVDGKTGFLCAQRSVSSLADAMDRIADLAPEERRALGEAGRARMIVEFAEPLVHRAYREALIGALRQGA